MQRAILLSLAIAATAANAQVYEWTDSSGHQHYSDEKPKSQEKTLIVDERIKSEPKEPIKKTIGGLKFTDEKKNEK